MIQAEIITIGDELLIGQTINTNSAWIGEQLSLIGINTHQITSITDEEQHIKSTLDRARKYADLIIITGGLGPTNDDITKQVLADYFDIKLVEHKEILELLKQKYNNLQLPFDEVNRAQALLPEKAHILPNKRGTASGMWFEEKGTVFIALPGVPYEMKGILTEEGFSKIKQHFSLPKVIHRTVKTIGIAESRLANILKEWEKSLKKNNVKLAYLPSPGFVRLRLSAFDANEKIEQFIQGKAKELYQLAGEYIYAEGKTTLEEVVGEILTKQQKTLSVAESCTGGTVGQLLTSVSGASSYFKGGVIAYSNEIKNRLLDVETEILNQYGAVSQPVVEQMAKSVRQKFLTDYSIAISGVAGPSGGTEEKPLGTVWIAVATPTKVIAKKFHIPYNNRKRNIIVSANFALELLRKELLIEFKSY